MASSRDSQLATIQTQLGSPLTGYSSSWRATLLIAAVGVAVAALGLSLKTNLFWVGTFVLVASMRSAVLHVAFSGYRVCPGGLILFRWGRVETCTWQAIATLEFLRTRFYVNGMSAGTESTLSGAIVRRDGRRFELVELTRPTAEYIELMTNEVLLPEVEARLEAGDAVSFGGVTLTREGLRHRGVLHSYDHVEALEFRHLVVVRMREGPVLYLHGILNLSLFYTLVTARIPDTGPSAERVESAA